MDSSNDDALAGLFLFGIIVAAVVTAIVMAIIVVGAIGVLIAIGIAASLLTRALLGLIGDELGATPTVARNALALFWLAPIPYLLASAPMPLLVRDPIAQLLWLGTWVISVPAYYWAYWAKEIPRLDVKLDLPFKTEAAMRAEEQIIWLSLQANLTHLSLRIKMEWLKFLANLRKSLRVSID